MLLRGDAVKDETAIVTDMRINSKDCVKKNLYDVID